VEVLAARFLVSPQTIPKDLNALCGRGILQRVHGGAMVSHGIINYAYAYAYAARREPATDAKHRIGEKAASLISDNHSPSLHIGTATKQMARYLGNKHRLLSITNNIYVSNTMMNFPGCDVINAGGVVRRLDGAEWVRRR